MQAFVRVVQTGSFTAVAKEQQTTKATISKKVAALENKLGVKLLTRSSREHSLTQVGADYYEKCVVILAELEEAEAAARSEIATPRGTLHITAPVPLGYILLAPTIQAFTERYPEIRIEANFTDQHVDLISEGVDLAIRASQLEDSSLIASKLFDNPMLIVGSPDYLKKYGIPGTPDELANHNCIIYSPFKRNHIWSFHKNGQTYSASVKGSQRSNCGLYNMQLALTGAGITPLPIWMVKDDLESGRLVQVLCEYQADNIPFHAV